MSRMGERLVAVLVVSFLLVYAGYQAYRFFFNPFQTETVFDYTVSQSVDAQGVVIRSETLLDAASGTGVGRYLFEDGQRVTVGQTVAEFYTSAAGGENKYRVRELENEIQALKEARSYAGTVFSNTDTLGRDIRDQLSKVTQMTNTGKYSGVDEVRISLITLINKKQVSTGREPDFTGRISRLEKELEQLNSVAKGDLLSTVTAPASGYFVHAVDGYEAVIDASVIGNYTLEQYKSLLQNPKDPKASSAAGKVVTNQNWYYACAVPKYQVEWMWTGQSISVLFEQAGGSHRVPAVIREILTEQEDEEAVLVLQCNLISEDLVSLRYETAIIQVEELWGLRVNSSSLHFEGEQRGVYILENGSTIRFRQLDPIYETSSYVLSRIDESNPNLLQMYDTVIVKGKDLYDEKHVG